jgi:uncharacterized membrane protein
VNVRHKLRLHIALLILLLCTVTLVVWDLAPAARTGLGLVSILLVPGGAALARTRVSGWPEWIGLSVSVSIALQTVGTLAMLWSRWWHPGVLAAGLAAGSAALLSYDVWQKRKEVRFGAGTARI